MGEAGKILKSIKDQSKTSLFGKGKNFYEQKDDWTEYMLAIFRERFQRNK